MKNNILFYIPTINQRDGGIRQYSYNLLKLISENNKENYNFYIYHKKKDRLFLDLVETIDNFELIPNSFLFKSNIKISVFVNRVINAITNNNFNLDDAYIDFLIKKFKINIIHSPYQFIPKTKKAKVIVTMHDVQQKHFPEFFSQEELKNREKNHKEFIEKADRVIVSYDHIYQDLNFFFNLTKEKALILPIGLSNLWIKEFIYDDNLRFEYGTFLLYPANSWKHKNHIGMIEALNLLKKKNILINVIFTGDFNSVHGEFLINKINEYELNSQIKVLGLVTQNELYGLYKNALGVVIPTIYEAGSYPLYESIWMEKPVICSNVTSLPETIGDTRFIFSPHKYDEIANLLHLIYNDKKFREESRNNSSLRKEQLLNNNSIAILYNTYNTI